MASFHWEIEFPEVFDRENPGFDAIVGNPPFAGKNSVIAANTDEYPHWLKTMHMGSHGNADLAAHFFRKAYLLLRNGGNFGLVATNTISQGDTRSTGLRVICTSGGEIYNVTRRLPWPGQAAVIVSVVHIHRGAWRFECKLDGIQVPSISAYLAVGSTHEDPAKLAANRDQSFVGSYVLGMGFTFDDTDKKGVASSLSEMQRLIQSDPKNQRAVFPYIGGAELNSSPNHTHHRYVINFQNYPLRRDPDIRITWFKASHEQRQKWLQKGVVPHDYPDLVAADWPDLLEIVEDKVWPIRRALRMKSRRERWWQYGGRVPNLYQTIHGMKRVLAISRVGQHAGFGFLSNGMVYADSLIIFPFDSYAAFCVLQCRLHEVWARFFGSTLGDGLRYTPTDCFETYAFPQGWSSNPRLELAGKAYYEARAELMVKTGLGLTKIYNEFHSRNAHDPDIARLRELHDQMDRAVLNEYGWGDILPKCDFLCDHEDENSTSSHRFWRYRWPDKVQDKVLGRLIDLNAHRANKERVNIRIQG